MKQVKKNIFFLLLLQGANYVLPLITLPYIVRVVGVKFFGVLALANVVVVYFNILIDYGFNLSATREISINRNNLNKISEIFYSVIIIKIFLLFLSFIILNCLLYLYDKFAEYKLVFYYTFLMLIGKVLFPVWFFQGIEKMGYITFINIASKVFFTILIFLLIKDAQDYIYIPLINSIGMIIGGLIGFIIAVNQLKFVIPKLKTLIFYFKESTSLFVSNVSITLFTASNTLILGIFASEHIVGIYSSIERLIMAIKNLFVPIYQGIYPWLAKKNNKEIKKFISKIKLPILILSLIITNILFLFSKEILALIYNNKYIIEYHYILKIFAFVPLLSALNMLYNFLYLNAIKAYKIRMKIFIIAGIYNVCVGLVLTYLFSIWGITIAVVSTEFLLLLLGIWYFSKKIIRI